MHLCYVIRNIQYIACLIPVHYNHRLTVLMEICVLCEVRTKSLYKKYIHFIRHGSAKRAGTSRSVNGDA